MDIDTTLAFFGWCTLFNVGLLLIWFLFFWLAHDWMYQFHSKLCRLSVETFDSIHYAGMAIFKVGIFMLNLVPYWALLIVR